MLNDKLRKLLPLLALLGCGRPAPAHDIAVTAVELAPAPAGQPSLAFVSLTNRGTRTLHPQDYLVEIEAPGTAEEMRRNACGSRRTHVFMDAPEEIEPGQTRVVPVHHIFARAGTMAMTVQVTLAAGEDGSTRHDAVTLTRTVPESPCAHVASR
jgi:hypothetical protein